MCPFLDSLRPLPCSHKRARMLYEVRVAANKGLGLFAKLPIPRGTRILAEKPLVALRSGQRPSDILGYAKKLDEKSREQLLGLSWHPGSGIKRLGRWSEALGWAVRNRRTKGERIEREDGKSVAKASLLIARKRGEMLKDLNEAFRILSIFRSNSFNLASSAPSPPTNNMTSASPVADPNTVGAVSETLKADSAIDATMKAASSSAAYELALFPVIARINHSCLPNAQANYHPLHRTFNVHATRDIPAGEEVSINYLPEVGQLQGQRVAKLEEGYGFTCNCPACDLSTNAGKEGEQSRKETRDSMKETRAYFAGSTNVTETVDVGYGADGMPGVLEHAVADDAKQRLQALRDMPARERQEWLREREIEALNLMLDMYRREDIVGREVASIYYHLARLQSSGDAFDDALTNARVGLRLEEDCLGADHPEYLVALAFVESLKKAVRDVRAAAMKGSATL